MTKKPRKRRRKKTPEPETADPEPPAEVRRPRAIQQIERHVIRCDYCRSDKHRNIGASKSGGIAYYRCKVCVDPGTRDYRIFKVRILRVDPDAQDQQD